MVTAAVSKAKVASGLKLSSAKLRKPAPAVSPGTNADTFTRSTQGVGGASGLKLSGSAKVGKATQPVPGRGVTTGVTKLSGSAKAPEYTPTISPLSRGIGDAFTASTKTWGTLTGIAGLTPNLRRVPQDVLSANQEAARSPPFATWRAEVESKHGKTYSDLDLHPRYHTKTGNLARYANKNVHLYVQEGGARMYRLDGSPNMTANEVRAGRTVNIGGPGVETVDGEQKFTARTGSAPQLPTPPDRVREMVERGGAALNGAGLLFAAGNALTNAPRQVGETVDSLKRGDIAGAVNNGSQVAKHAANLVATGGQLIEDAGKYLPKVVPPAVAKAAGRFVPGANVAIAALDTAQAVKSWADPNASTGKKVGDTITAAGSIIATIPGLNFVGGAVATGSSLLTSWLFPT
ncbi:hypothetical protein [Pyxidicoccus xibeiensis]|uniref:hypothetical protein n=1 Tax=Pyxidicoccus xibeiensis TaxID=2906759 RepID=UPI0020A7C701|nr:hypothetical protein [Pyxidicoccus xibeiensis]MCP3143567.1 hypothetical protein [Pyxidicoccus xibeiensis]